MYLLQKYEIFIKIAEKQKNNFKKRLCYFCYIRTQMT